MAILRLDTGCNAYIPHIHIGREAENDVSQIDFVVQSWIDTYGDGGVSLAVQRYGDKEAYIVPLAIVDGVATWTISDTDTAKEGRGSVQLTYVVGEKVKKSQIYKIVVDSSLVGSDAVPDPYDNWLAILTEMTAQTGANADSARVSAQEAAKSEANAKASEANAKASETNAKASEANAKASETNAKASETNAKASEEASAQSATSASASAVNASADAQRAETAEANAEESAANAKADADSAKADADRAEQAAATATAKAQEATQDAQTANTASQTATAKASEASASASTASTAATTATTKAQAASESATTAQTAQTSAQTAQGLAEQAQTAAETAQGAAESARDEAQEIVDGITGKVEQIDSNTEKIESLEDDRYKSYVTDSASGSIASFPDGADDIPLKSCIVQVEPVQDLHGYDHPWPAGGGVNQFAIADAVGVSPSTSATYGLTTTLDNTAETIRIHGTPNWSDTSASVTFRCISTAKGNYYGDAPVTHDYSGMAYKIFPIRLSSNVSAIYALSISSSTIAVSLTKTGNADIDVLFKIVIATAGTTIGDWTPYSNICPISGFEGLTVTRTGKNIINPSELVYHAKRNNVWYCTQLPPDTDFVFSTDSIITGLYVAYSDDDEMPSISRPGWTEIVYKYNTTSLRFNSGSHKWYRLMTYETNGVIRDRLYQLELGTTATAYEPYQGETYDIAFPSEAGTVYGGTLTIAEDGSGVLTVDMAMVDMGSMAWNYNTTYAFFASNSISTRKIGVLNVWSDLFKTMEGSWSGTPVQNALWGNGSNATLYVQTPPLDNVNDFMALVDGHQLMYELATPITYQLTPQEIRTLLGANNIWADTGDVSVEYRADTKLYINKKIAEAISALS